MPDDVIDRPPTRTTIVCEFCDCTLAATGDVLKRSPRARAMMQLEEELDAARKRADTLTADLTAARQALSDATRREAPSRRAIVYDDDTEGT